MLQMEVTTNVLDGLLKDPVTGDYRVQPGYEHQAHRYRIHETWLDEDDDLWVSKAAVERELQKTEEAGSQD